MGARPGNEAGRSGQLGVGPEGVKQRAAACPGAGGGHNRAMAESRTLSRSAEIARARDPDRFLCALFAPAERQEALFTLIAYNSELAHAREAARNPLAALMRLQWWRETVEAAAAGGPPRRHEVAAPLHAAIMAGSLDAGDLSAMADARETETAEEGIPSRGAFLAYLRGTAGGFAVAAGRLLGAPPALLPALQEAGALYGLAGVLRSVPALARQGRCLLPRDALAEHGLVPEAMMRAPGEAPARAVSRRWPWKGGRGPARSRDGCAACRARRWRRRCRWCWRGGICAGSRRGGRRPGRSAASATGWR